MNEIKCPKCGTVFQISETDYANIVKQIRDKEFQMELASRDEQYKRDKENAVKLTEAQVKEELNEKINKQELEINELKNQLKTKEEQTKSKVEDEYKDKLNDKLLEINELKNQLKVQETKQELELEKALSEKNKEIDSLNNELELKSKEYELKEKQINETYETKLKDKDDQIAQYKDFKVRQSTKMIGESLEQHCSTEFNRLRPLFKNAYFEKDNDARTGSKGDFIFRDYDDDGNEIVSIMFEMKNEADETATKHKNQDFLKELDKDRNEKKCEYAVLVSMLEIDNDLYNDGIVDMSYQYDKMYVIRPQFFIPLITLIRNLATKSLDYRKELELVKNQNIDITHFEEKMFAFKEGFDKNCRIASEKFQTAIDEIDKSINHLQKIKDALISSENNLRRANDKVTDLSIKKLTYNNPTMSKMFKEAKKDKKEITVESEEDLEDIELDI